MKYVHYTTVLKHSDAFNNAIRHLTRFWLKMQEITTIMPSNDGDAGKSQSTTHISRVNECNTEASLILILLNNMYQIPKKLLTASKQLVMIK
jgi:hypothetical protein